MHDVGTTRHDQILTAALSVFGRHGYRRTSMELIARAAGVSRPALYQRFSGKEDVFRAMSARMLDGVLDAATMAGSADAPVADRLYDVLSVKVEFFVGTIEAEFRREMLADAASVAGDVATSFNERFTALIEDTLASSAELDLLGDPLPASDVAVLLLAAVAGIMQEEPEPAVLYPRLRQLVTLTVSGLSSRR
ncbi:MAG TPA: helix-turn-helix domain-containing protein [Pseudonocardiaceae bacterium]|nr:helix-turn-helix domain-containing protein [Pseudonocardiaceae bacterium]